MHSLEVIVARNESPAEKDTRVLEHLRQWVDDASDHVFESHSAIEAYNEGPDVLADYVSAKTVRFIQELHADILWPLVAAARKFVEKVERGEARSTETYGEMKRILEKIGGAR